MLSVLHSGHFMSSPFCFFGSIPRRNNVFSRLKKLSTRILLHRCLHPLYSYRWGGLLVRIRHRLLHKISIYSLPLPVLCPFLGFLLVFLLSSFFSTTFVAFSPASVVLGVKVVSLFVICVYVSLLGVSGESTVFTFLFFHFLSLEPLAIHLMPFLSYNGTTHKTLLGYYCMPVLL